MEDWGVEGYPRRKYVLPITPLPLNQGRQRGINHWLAKNLIHQVIGETQFCSSSGIWYASYVYFWLMSSVFRGNSSVRWKRWYGEVFTKKLKKSEKLTAWYSLKAVPLSQYSRTWDSWEWLISTSGLFWPMVQVLALCREITCDYWDVY